jgi:DMSO reductase anchor subunit
MELIDIIRQNVWGRMAALNFILGGTAAGAYLLMLWYGPISEPLAAAQSAWWKLLSVLPAGLGFAGVLFESGRPLNSIFLLNRLRTSWMSREALAGMIFILAAGADLLFPQKGIALVAATAAAALIATQGFMLYTARAVPAWNKSLVLLLTATSALSSGLGFLLLTGPWFDAAFTRKPILTGVLVLALNLGTWLVYLYHTTDRFFQKATQALRSKASWVMVVVLGHGVPLVWLLALFLAASEGKVTVSPLSCVMIGLLVWVGTAYQKAAVVLRCSYLNSISWLEPNSREHAAPIIDSACLRTTRSPP